MSKMIAIRDAYGEALKSLGAKNDRVVVLEADVGSSSKSILFGKEFPERYYNVGIAELNMAGMAAGFAYEGKIPFINTFATFMVGRAADPINSLIAYDNLNVKLCGTYCGLSDSYDGASHHSASDIAYFRSLPNMTVISVCDEIETKKAVEAAAAVNGPVYLRLSRAPAEVIFDDTYDFRIGKGVILREGKDATLIGTGCMVQKCLEAAGLLEAMGYSVRVVDIHTIKPIDEEIICDSAAKTGAIVTVEEHSIYGGLGSAVSEVLAKSVPTPMGMIGLTEFAESGDYDELLAKYSLDANAIVKKAIEQIKRK